MQKVMHNSSLSHRKEVAFHLIFWASTVVYYMIDVRGGHVQFLFSSVFSWTWLLIYALTFYANYLLVLPRVFKRFHWLRALIGFLSLYLLFVFLRYIIEQVATDWLLGAQNYFPNTRFGYYLFDNLYFSFRPVGISTVIWLVIKLIRTIEQNQHIVEEQKNTEIKFLKAQINPHFIFNTLNNIYAMVHFQSPHALAAIEKLSNIMRFTTYESHKEKIKLNDELDYINACVELEQMRHDGTLFVQMDIRIENYSTEIAPHLLSPLVENALKHGDFSHDNPIEIRLHADDKKLHLYVRNQISTRKKDQQGGIGLDNLRHRLAILYPKRHYLDLENEEGTFSAQLKIQLS